MQGFTYETGVTALQQVCNLQINRVNARVADFHQDLAITKAAIALAELVEAKASAVKLEILQGGKL